MKFRVRYWNDCEDYEVFGKTYEATNECEAEGMFYDDDECQSTIDEFDDIYPVLVDSIDENC